MDYLSSIKLAWAQLPLSTIYCQNWRKDGSNRAYPYESALDLYNNSVHKEGLYLRKTSYIIEDEAAMNADILALCAHKLTSKPKKIVHFSTIYRTFDANYFFACARPYIDIVLPYSNTSAAAQVQANILALNTETLSPQYSKVA